VINDKRVALNTIKPARIQMTGKGLQLIHLQASTILKIMLGQKGKAIMQERRYGG